MQLYFQPNPIYPTPAPRHVQTRLSLALLEFSDPFLLQTQFMRIPNTPQADHEARHASNSRHKIRGTVALQTIRTLPDAAILDNGMLVVNRAIEEIEDVATNNWGEGHRAPVLREAMNAESFGNEGWEAAK